MTTRYNALVCLYDVYIVARLEGRKSVGVKASHIPKRGLSLLYARHVLALLNDHLFCDNFGPLRHPSKNTLANRSAHGPSVLRAVPCPVGFGSEFAARAVTLIRFRRDMIFIFPFKSFYRPGSFCLEFLLIPWSSDTRPEINAPRCLHVASDASKTRVIVNGCQGNILLATQITRRAHAIPHRVGTLYVHPLDVAISGRSPPPGPFTTPLLPKACTWGLPRRSSIPAPSRRSSPRDNKAVYSQRIPFRQRGKKRKTSSAVPYINVRPPVLATREQEKISPDPSTSRMPSHSWKPW